MTSAGTESDTRNLAFGISVEAVDQFQVETSGAKAMYEGQGVANYVLQVGHQPVSRRRIRILPQYRFRRPRLFRGHHAHRAPERIWRHHQRAHQEEQDFFLRQLRRLSLRFRVASRIPEHSHMAERTGDFSAFPADHLRSHQRDRDRPRTPFPNNVIPPSRISSISQSFQSYLPAPTNGNITNNYLATLPETVNNNNTTEKVDYNLSDKNRLFGMISRGKYSTNFTGSLTPISTSHSALALHRRPHCGGIRHTGPDSRQLYHHAHPHQSVQLCLSRLWIPLVSDTAGGDYPMKAGLTGLPPGPESLISPSSVSRQ